MEKIAVRTSTYKTRFSGFLVDIVSDGKLYHAWLYHEEFGVKSCVVGAFKKDITRDDFIDVVDSDLERHIELYKNDHMGIA